jgi:3-hydroxyacyl-[acyl-carrier-protein] dehydratase
MGISRHNLRSHAIMVLSTTDIQKILPHRYPFLLIDKVTEIIKGKSITAHKNITITEEIFQGHFPQHPIYPGVLIIEGMAQSGGILALKSMSEVETSEEKVVYFMSINNAKFRIPVRPGDQLVYQVRLLKSKRKIWVLSGKASVDGNIVAEAEFMTTIVDKDA